jgi:hypothetical protein
MIRRDENKATVMPTVAAREARYLENSDPVDVESPGGQ